MVTFRFVCLLFVIPQKGGAMKLPHDRELLTRREAAEILGLQEQTLGAWATRGVHLPFIKTGHAVRYRKSDIEQWLEKQTIRPNQG
jgi:excisionase family DNA binding protein